MKKEDFQQIAQAEGLSVEPTTTDRTGYPTHEEWALTGFETWEQAERVSGKYGLTLFWGSQKSGWHNWYVGCDFALEPMTCYEAFSDDRYDVYDSFDEYRIQEEAYMKEELEDISNNAGLTEEERKSEAEAIKERYENKFDNIKKWHTDGYALLFANGEYEGSYPKEMVSYSYDDRIYAVVAMDRP